MYPIYYKSRFLYRESKMEFAFVRMESRIQEIKGEKESRVGSEVPFSLENKQWYWGELYD